MTLQFSNKMIVGIAITLALLWSLTLAVCYALLGFSGEFGQWMTDLLSLTPDTARWLLAAGNGLAYAPLGAMLIEGEGGPADEARGIELLGSDTRAKDGQADDGLGRAMLADLYIDGIMVPRLPRKAMALMTDHALLDLETRQRLGELIAYLEFELVNHPKVSDAAGFLRGLESLRRTAAA